MERQTGLLYHIVQGAFRGTGDVRLPLPAVELREHRQQITFGPANRVDSMNVQNPSSHYLRSRETGDSLVESHSLAYFTKVYMLANTQTMRPRTPSRNPCLST